MKKYIKFIVFMSLIYIDCSCDDYLKTESNSTFTEETAFTNLDFATKTVNSIYVNFTSQYMYDYYLGLFYKLDNDIECTYTSDDGARASLAHYAGTDGSTSLSNVWNILYSTIERANICIDNLPGSPVWEGEYADNARWLYGQAVTLRAYCYYELISLWGDVPFQVKSTQSGDDFYLPKTDRDSIYEYLIQDLKDVEDYVPWMDETQTTERVNKAFVKGLRARMALAYAGYSLRNTTFETRRGRYWEDYYKITNQECLEIIESGKHQLNPSFENIFKLLHAYAQDLTYGEVLFDIAYGRLYSGRVGYTIGMAFCSSPANPTYGKAAAEIKVTPSYFYSFDRNDTRRNVSSELYSYKGKSMQQEIITQYNTYPCKWRKNWIDPSMGGDLASASFTGVNWPLMRYADVVLMYAESENEINGPTQAAKDALSLIRQRAFSKELWASKVTHYVDSVSVSKDDFFNAVVDERSWEFGGEMLRKYDLVRWNLLGPKIKKMRETVRKFLDDDPEYAELVPSYLYFKYEDDGETINILNPDYRLPYTQIEGYNATSWFSTYSSTEKTKISNYMNVVAHGYDETKNNHLYPIASTIISASNGMLSNDQIP